MENFTKYFRFQQLDQKKSNNIYYVRTSFDNYELKKTIRFDVTAKLPPINSLISSNLYEELTEVFASEQENKTTKIGFDKSDNIICSNIRKNSEKIFEEIDADIRLYVEDIKPLSNDSHTPCFKYIPLVHTESIPSFPHIEMFISHLSEPDKFRFKMYIGSMFDTENKSKQALHMYDSCGNSGKSTFMNALTKFISTELTYSISSVPNDEFWLSNLDQTLMLVFNEIDDPKLLDNASLKALMGNDVLRVKRKFVQESKTLDAKFKMFIVSNHSLLASDKSFSTSRLIVCDFNKLNFKRLDYVLDEDNNLIPGYDLQGKIDDEMQYFIKECINVYLAAGKPKQIAEIDGCTLLTHSDSDETITEIFNKYFEVSSTVSKKDRLSTKIMRCLLPEIIEEQKLINAKVNWNTAKINTKFNLNIVKVKGFPFYTNLVLKDMWIFDEDNREIVKSTFTKQTQNQTKKLI